jgi:predicted secreted protein
MTITAAFVTFLMIWFLCLFVALPIGIRTQGEAGSVVEGTPSSAPEFSGLRRKVLWVTGVTVVLWAVIYWLVALSGLSIEDIDIWGSL